MIAELGRHLHQPMEEVLEWEVETFFDFHSQILPILEAENPKR